MDILVVPLALSRLEIDRDQRFGKQVVAGPMPAVEIRGRRFDRQVREAEVFVDRDLRPHTRVAIHRPRVVLPCLAAQFARARNGVEGPQQLSRASVERPDQTLRVVVRRNRLTFAERRADDDDVFRNGGCRVDTNLAGLQIDRLSVSEHHTLFQVDDTVGTEGTDHRARPSVQ